MHSPAVERAIAAALHAHDGQTRRGTDVPYFVHPVQVGLILAHNGLDVPVIQAGILHGVVEDCEEWTIARVRAEFGETVAGIVDELTEDKSLSWDERKWGTVDQVPSLSDAAVAVKAADKLHNLTSLVAKLEEADDREAVWSRFRGGRERTVRYSIALVEALEPRAPRRLGEELRRAVERLRELAE